MNILDLPDPLDLLAHGAEGLRLADLVEELLEALGPRPQLQLGCAAMGRLSGCSCECLGSCYINILPRITQLFLTNSDEGVGADAPVRVL